MNIQELLTEAQGKLFKAFDFPLGYKLAKFLYQKCSIVNYTDPVRIRLPDVIEGIDNYLLDDELVIFQSGSGVAAIFKENRKSKHLSSPDSKLVIMSADSVAQYNLTRDYPASRIISDVNNKLGLIDKIFTVRYQDNTYNDYDREVRRSRLNRYPNLSTDQLFGSSQAGAPVVKVGRDSTLIDRISRLRPRIALDTKRQLRRLVRSGKIIVEPGIDYRSLEDALSEFSQGRAANYYREQTGITLAATWKSCVINSAESFKLYNIYDTGHDIDSATLGKLIQSIKTVFLEDIVFQFFKKQ